MWPVARTNCRIGGPDAVAARVPLREALAAMAADPDAFVFMSRAGWRNRSLLQVIRGSKSHAQRSGARPRRCHRHRRGGSSQGVWGQTAMAAEFCARACYLARLRATAMVF